MPTANLKSQLDEVKNALARHKTKTAQAAPESFPESGGTKATPAGTFGSDPQLKKDNEVPASSRTTAGAADDINPKLAPSILTGGTPSPDAPSKITPMTSDGKDATQLNPDIKVASAASALGRDLLLEIDRIQGIQKKAQAELAAAPVQKVAEPTPPTVPAKETQTATAKAETDKPVATTKVPDEIPAELKPKTAGDVLAMTEPMLAKIASICLADAEGADFVSKKVVEHMGKEAADRAMSVLRAQHDQIVALEKSAAENDELSLYEKLGQEVVDMAVDNALGEMNPADPSLGAAAMGGAPAGDPAMGGMPGGMPGGEAPVDPAAIEAALAQASPEELEQVIGELLASGQLSEEDLAAITAALGDEGGAPAGGPAGAPPAEAPAEPAQAAPSEPASESAPEKEEAKETAPEGEEKSASVKAKAKTGAAALLQALSDRKGK